MKKLLLALAFVASGFIFANAQTVTHKDAKTAPAKTEKKQEAAKPALVKNEGDGVVMKKDGTPDKRYKAKEANGPMKKDGTPDKRYKANKDTKKTAK